MRRFLIVVLVAACAATTGGASGAGHPVLVGKVGLHDAFRISLTFPSGRPVRSIQAGVYTIVVHDYSRIHNFALGSVTANRRIFTGSVPGVGTTTHTLTLRAGTYAYACSAHPQTMHGTFVVTAG